MTKKDKDNPDYTSIILCSKGLGANYAKENQLKHRWNKEKTIITYKANNGQDSGTTSGLPTFSASISIPNSDLVGSPNSFFGCNITRFNSSIN